jgi:DNA-binding NarL/FixJ family response regulator
MPVMDGLQATAAIKAAYPNLPIVVWSVADSALDAEPSYPAGADAFLTKDVPAAVLLRCIRHLVRRSRQSSRLREDVDHARRRGGP